jgi:hypothetical protein
MDTTAELGLAIKRSSITPEQVELVATYLRDKAWVKGEEICADLKITDRMLRKIVEFADGRIISGPGSPGYRLFTREALADADAVASSFESQGKRMLQHAIAIRRRFHHFPRASESTS